MKPFAGRRRVLGLAGMVLVFAGALVAVTAWPSHESWSPTCQHPPTDADRLHQALTGDPDLAGKGPRYWQAPGWQPAVRRAVSPLGRCGASYRERLARFVSASWPESRSARLTVAEILALPRSRPATGSLHKIIGCKAPCTVTAQVSFDHPTWGPCVLATTQSASDSIRDSTITVVDASGVIRWQHWAGAWFVLTAATPATDTTGNIFLTYNPGRYTGVIVLRPTPGGFVDFGSLPAPDDYLSVFYGASPVDVNRDSVYEIDKTTNNCDPSCAEGAIDHSIIRWNGATYVADH
ncbi:MAG: hypothetical protein JXA67_01885 [Micromonosporaceae bacterium]|nr:hypothetical protein [Micromonosporaceae bacterium]